MAWVKILDEKEIQLYAAIYNRLLNVSKKVEIKEQNKMYHVNNNHEDVAIKQSRPQDKKYYQRYFLVKRRIIY